MQLAAYEAAEAKYQAALAETRALQEKLAHNLHVEPCTRLDAKSLRQSTRPEKTLMAFFHKAGSSVGAQLWSRAIQRPCPLYLLGTRTRGGGGSVYGWSDRSGFRANRRSFSGYCSEDCTASEAESQRRRSEYGACRVIAITLSMKRVIAQLVHSSAIQVNVQLYLDKHVQATQALPNELGQGLLGGFFGGYASMWLQGCEIPWNFTIRASNSTNSSGFPNSTEFHSYSTHIPEGSGRTQFVCL